ncbi:putative acyl-CoA dehydrogenase [Inhella inkyongensis]|uniref:Putative acyl-CoA dehydrogenase n=1 Tax=Inhella inkyongensis TaxID=392593 RepID=A0A840RYW0_9BURK|nr:acyl-CoA dehydrogenase family protein [Inhella inkyongensis]MBB5203155.1 putative acyl-CoA dehydrogenase [Inhella inkyongensis]
MNHDNEVDECRALDLWATDPSLRAHFGDDAELARYGAQIGSAQAQDWAEQANRRPPELQTHDARGRRIDRVDFHPHWHRLLAGLRASGAIALPHAQNQWQRSAAFFYLHGQVEAGSLCPATMTQAALPVLARHASGLYAALQHGLLSREHDHRDQALNTKRSLWLGMGMTEKQGGSDLRACTSQARPDGGDWRGAPRYLVSGHKWFFSAPMSDAHLVLAQTEEGPSCFLLPRWRLDGGGLNGVRIQRLKDKLGNRSNSSSEVEFEDCEAYLVGTAGRGIPILVEMAGITRLQCVVGSAALLRAGLVQAVHWAGQRRAFGRLLVDQPLMQQVLGDLALESEAALQLMLRLAQAFESRDQDPVERAWARVLTPAAKLWVCKRAVAACGEAMEVLGGNGYVETGSLARLYREAPVNSIWEGSGNVMALDVLRAAQREGEALQAWFDALLPDLEASEQVRARALCDALRSPDEAQARALAQELVLLAQAQLLRRHSPATMAQDFLSSRLHRPGGMFGASPLAHARAHLERAIVFP